MWLRGKVALITLGAEGLGVEVAKELSQEGASLAIHYYLAQSKDNAVALAEHLCQSGSKVSLHSGDLTSAGACEQLFQDVLKLHERVNILVNTIDMVLNKPIGDISEAEYDVVFGANSKATFFLLKAAAKHIQFGGNIVTVVTALSGPFTGYYASYVGSKAPVHHFMNELAESLKHKQISVNNVATRPMDSIFFRMETSLESIAYLRGQGVRGQGAGGQITETKNMAPLVRFLCTDAGWMTGQTFFANGAYKTP